MIELVVFIFLVVVVAKSGSVMRISPTHDEPTTPRRKQPKGSSTKAAPKPVKTMPAKLATPPAADEMSPPGKAWVRVGGREILVDESLLTPTKKGT